jgi:hypothetical protein
MRVRGIEYRIISPQFCIFLSVSVAESTGKKVNQINGGLFELQSATRQKHNLP